MRLNDALATGRAHYGVLEESVQDKVATSKAHTEAMFANLGSEYPGLYGACGFHALGRPPAQHVADSSREVERVGHKRGPSVGVNPTLPRFP